MKNWVNKYAMILLVVALVGCAPVGTEPASPSTTASETAILATSTGTATSTELSTTTPTFKLTFTAEASVTQTLVLLPGATIQPTRTRRPPRQKTRTPSPTATFTATIERTATASRTPPAKLCPTATAEPFYVAPVTSPTDQYSQIVTVYLGHGEQVTIIAESGTFTDTTRPFQVEVTLLPNTVHHLNVQGKVKQVWTNGCLYGGYTLTTRSDGYGAPLTIVQGLSYP